MPLRIEPVRTPKDLHAFVTFPMRLYRDDPNWVPPLIGDTKNIFNRKKNPFYDHGDMEIYLARRDDDVIGRVAAIRNRAHEEFQQEQVGFFGFFERVDDPEVAMGLLGTAREYLRAQGLPRMLGPVNPTTNDECGVLIEGFDTPPMVMMTHNHAYYDRLLHQCGLEKAKDLVAYVLTADTMPERLARGAALARKRNPDLVVRPMNMKRFQHEVDAFRTVYNGAWEKNWGFVPMTDHEVDHMAKALKPVVDPELVRIGEHEGRPVAFALGLPDMNFALKHAGGKLFPFGLLKILWYARKNTRARILALGLLPEYRRTGLDVILYHDLFEAGLAKGYRTGEFSWILEDNMAMRRPLDSIGATPYKTYRLYQGPVEL